MRISSSRWLFGLFLLLIAGPLFAQQYGNEWINYNQEYYKVKTGKNGIHRLTYENIVNAGLSVPEVNPANLQLFHRGEEVSIFVSGQEDGSFEPEDYIDFYGVKNDGTQDTELYIRPSHQPHTYHNLFSDTTAYFLTVASTAGKRMPLSAESSAGLTVEDHHSKEILNLYTSQFSFGQYYPIGNLNGESKLAQYDLGQGWIGSNIEKNAQTEANGTNHRDFVVDGIFLTEETLGRPQLEIQIVGFGNVLHNARIFVGPSQDDLRLIRDNFLLNYASHGFENQQLQWSDISPTGRLFVRVEEVGFPEFARDVVFVSYIKVTFPQEVDVQSESGVFFNFDKPELGLARLNIDNVVERQRAYDITDTKNPIRLVTTDVSDNSVETVIDMTSRLRTVYTEDESKPVIPSIERVRFSNRDLGNADYLIISHAHLKQAGGGYDDPVQAYVDYRSSIEGGGFNVYYADVMTLYDEFSYGEFTPLALKRFNRYAYDTANPKYLFLIGKSRRVDNGSWRLPNPIVGPSRHLVPTIGAPGSDILYTAGLSGRENYPAYPVGRLSVSEPANVGYYLNKVKEKESTLKDSPWAKNFLHFSGGTTTSEITLFRNFVQGFEEVVAADFLGANVNSIFKRNNNSVQFFNVSEEVNRGVGFVTFFGHSSNQFTDIDIGNVTDDRNGYFNAGRYPAFLVNGCRGGEIFFFNSFGENWLAAENRGATNFISHTDVGIPVPLQRYTKLFYETISDTLHMTKSIGLIQQRVIGNYLDQFNIDEIGVAMVQENLLQGDPALQIFGNDKVDYIVRDEDIFLESIDGKDITATTPFFRLGVVAGNSGRTTLDSLTVGVRRILPDGTIRQLPEVKIEAVRFQDTVYYDISNQGIDAFGDNTFEVTLDANDDVDEGSELNNTASLEINFPASGTFNTSPSNYSLISTDQATLVVQSAELRLNDKEYYVEIDTVNSFNSGWFQSNVVSGKGIGTWQVDLTNTNAGRDTVQYYWRTVFVEELELDPRPYATSSFTFIRNGVEGWGQTEFDQFEDLDLVSLQKDEVLNRWILVGSQTNIEVLVYGRDHPNSSSATNTTVNLNNVPFIVPQAGRLCSLNTLNAIAFDKDTGQPYVVLRTDGTFDIDDPLTCGPTPQVINRFTNNVLSDIAILPADSQMKAYVDGVATDDFVLIFTLGTVRFQDFRQDVRDDLGRLGTENILGNLQDGEPLVIFGRKDIPEGSATVVRGEPIGGSTVRTDKEVRFTGQINANTDRGSITTIPIGPSVGWGNLSHRINADPIEDVVKFDVIGVDDQGNETTLFADITEAQLDLSTIDPAVYPFIRLYLNLVDEESATPAQLENWLVTYQGVPEGIVSLQNDENRNVQLQEGEPFNGQFSFTNISIHDFAGPLTVRYTFTNQVTGEEQTSTLEIPAVLAGQSVDFEIPIETRGRVGLNDLEVFVNPGDQLEQFFNNNVLRLNSFYEVIRDNVNPAIDVTFDGIYILDGDIVSPNPLITMELRDNNQFLLKEDTLGVEIYLRENCETCERKRINFSSPSVNYFPATPSSNYRVEFQPDEALADGSHNLEVEATDATGNQSGITPYNINFEVINRSAISNFYPYPNPFSTSTRFVFTITGNVLPDQLKIQIFTVSGKLVREISQAELGPIRTGNNISDFAWDGKDEFGGQLANGTYIYRVVAKMNGQDIGQHFTAGDKGFRKGWGKLVILR